MTRGYHYEHHLTLRVWDADAIANVIEHQAKWATHVTHSRLASFYHIHDTEYTAAQDDLPGTKKKKKIVNSCLSKICYHTREMSKCYSDSSPSQEQWLFVLLQLTQLSYGSSLVFYKWSWNLYCTTLHSTTQQHSSVLLHLHRLSCNTFQLKPMLAMSKDLSWLTPNPKPSLFCISIPIS